MKISYVLTDRLLELYPLPGRLSRFTVESIRRVKPQSCYVEESKREGETAMSLSWDKGRVLYFFEMLESGHSFDPIEIDNRCDMDRVYPEPIVLDGHHRLTAAKLYGLEKIPATYGGLLSVLHYLTGKNKRCPK